MSTPQEAYLAEKARTGDWKAAIRLVRERFGFDLTQAKEVMLQAEGVATTLWEHQAQLAMMIRELPPLTPDDKAESWCLMRLDDNGNEFAVRGGLSRDAAEALALEYEAKGHKQMYWARRE